MMQYWGNGASIAKTFGLLLVYAHKKGVDKFRRLHQKIQSLRSPTLSWKLATLSGMPAGMSSLWYSHIIASCRNVLIAI